MGYFLKIQRLSIPHHSSVRQSGVGWEKATRLLQVLKQTKIHEVQRLKVKGINNTTIDKQAAPSCIL